MQSRNIRERLHQKSGVIFYFTDYQAHTLALIGQAFKKLK